MLAADHTTVFQMFLLSDDKSSDWSQALEAGRTDYQSKREHFLRFIEHPEALAELTIDPLADDPDVGMVHFRDCMPPASLTTCSRHGTLSGKTKLSERRYSRMSNVFRTKQTTMTPECSIQSWTFCLSTARPTLIEVGIDKECMSFSLLCCM